MRVVQVRRVLLRANRISQDRHRVLNDIVPHLRIAPAVSFGHILPHNHKRRLENKAESVLFVDEPIVANLCHIILKITHILRLIIPLRACLRQRVQCLAAHLHMDVLVHIELRQRREGVGLLRAVVQVQREHLSVLPFLYIPVVHTAVTGSQCAIQTLHHVALGLDVDDTALPRRVVFRRGVRDNLYLLYRAAVRAFQHGFQLVAAQVRRTPVDIHFHRLAVHRYIPVLVHLHTRRFLQQVLAVAARRKRRVADI